MIFQEIFKTSVSARWRVPYAVEENLRGMNEWQKDKVSGFLLLDVSRKIQKFFKEVSKVFQGSFKSFSRKFQLYFKEVSKAFQGNFMDFSTVLQGSR